MLVQARALLFVAFVLLLMACSSGLSVDNSIRAFELPTANPVSSVPSPISLPSSQSVRFSLLVDNGKAVEDPLAVYGRETVNAATRFIEVRLFEEVIDSNQSSTATAKSISPMVVDHALYSVADPFDINVASQANTILAYHELINRSDRRISGLKPFEDFHHLRPESTRAVSLFDTNLAEFFVSPAVGIPVPLKTGDVVGYLEVTVIPVQAASNVEYSGSLLPIAVRLESEQRLFDRLDCYVARGAVPKVAATMTVYISKANGAVVKSILSDQKQRWRVIKTMYPAARPY